MTMAEDRTVTRAKAAARNKEEQAVWNTREAQGQQARQAQEKQQQGQGEGEKASRPKPRKAARQGAAA